LVVGVPTGLASLRVRVQLFHSNQSNCGSHSKLKRTQDESLEVRPLSSHVRVLLVVQVYIVADPRVLEAKLAKSPLVVS
ncbi:hypothetical protein PFISCL1PPCAC_10498, partial [Pristionchus fissidentatus]